MSCMPEITSTLLVAAVAPRTGKIIKNGLSFLEEDLLQNCVLHFVQSIVRNRVGKLDFKQIKNEFSERGLTLIGLGLIPGFLMFLYPTDHIKFIIYQIIFYARHF